MRAIGVLALAVLVCAADCGRVVKLLVPAADGRKLLASEDGLALLRDDEFGDRPLAIVTFIGRARSGKSFGINTLLRVSHSDGFEVGHTFEPKTSGALVWSEPLGGGAEGAKVLLVDTEGLGAGAQVFDNAMLAVTSAISSRFVYHMMGYVYTEDVLRLHGLACLVEDYDRR